MKNIRDLDSRHIQFLFSDIDDTMTTDGKLSAKAYEMLWTLSQNGLAVIPVTGRPAGWCDMIARFWPVRGVIGENGAFYFSYDEKNKKMNRHWSVSENERAANQLKLNSIRSDVLKAVPEAAISADQFSRACDLAIDFCEDIPPLSSTDIQKIVSIFQKHGATAKISSIHVNGWFGNYDKLSMCRQFCKLELGFDIEKNQHSVAFSGDSPNDEPMFQFFENSVGVGNVLTFAPNMQHLPRFICTKESGDGFVEICEQLLKGARESITRQ